MTAPHGSMVAILLIATCGFSFVSAALVGGAINARINARQPTPTSRRWGWILGVTNLAHGAIGAWLVLRMTSSPERPETDVIVSIGAGALATLLVGVITLVAAARARRDEGQAGGNTVA